MAATEILNLADPSILTIVVPMAGRGSRFASVGYFDPKPLIPVHGQPMIKGRDRQPDSLSAAPVRLHLPA